MQSYRGAGKYGADDTRAACCCVGEHCGRVKKEGRETEQQYQARLETGRCEGGKACCALRLLEYEPEFLNERSLLEAEISRLGLLPKISLRTQLVR